MYLWMQPREHSGTLHTITVFISLENIRFIISRNYRVKGTPDKTYRIKKWWIFLKPTANDLQYISTVIMRRLSSSINLYKNPLLYVWCVKERGPKMSLLLVNSLITHVLRISGKEMSSLIILWKLSANLLQPRCSSRPCSCLLTACFDSSRLSKAF